MSLPLQQVINSIETFLGASPTGKLTLFDIRAKVNPKRGGKREDGSKASLSHTYEKSRFDAFWTEYIRSREYLVFRLNTLLYARDSSDLSHPFEPNVQIRDVAGRLAYLVSSDEELLKWLRRSQAIADSIGELLWHIATYRSIWPVIRDVSGPEPEHSDFDYAWIKIPDWCFFFAKDMRLTTDEERVLTDYGKWDMVGWSHENGSVNWRTSTSTASQNVNDKTPDLQSFASFAEYYDRRGAELVAGYRRDDESGDWSWFATNGTNQVDAEALCGAHDVIQFMHNPLLASANAQYFGRFKPDISLVSVPKDEADFAICCSMSVVPAPLTRFTAELGAFCFITLLFKPVFQNKNFHKDDGLQGATGDLWDCLDFIKLPIVKQLANEQYREAVRQTREAKQKQDEAEHFKRRFKAVQPLVNAANAAIAQLQTTAAQIGMQMERRADALINRSAMIASLFDEDKWLDLKTLPNRIKCLHQPEYYAPNVARAVLAHAISLTQGRSHARRARDVRKEILDPLSPVCKRLIHDADRNDLTVAQAVAQILTPSAAMLVSNDGFEVQSDAAKDVLKNPARGLMRMKRRLVRPFKHEFSSEDLPLDVIPVFVSGCFLDLENPDSFKSLDDCDQEVTTPDLAAWNLGGKFSNEVLLRFLGDYCNAVREPRRNRSWWNASLRHGVLSLRLVDEHRKDFRESGSNKIAVLKKQLIDRTSMSENLVVVRPSSNVAGSAGNSLAPLLKLISKVPPTPVSDENLFGEGDRKIEISLPSVRISIGPLRLKIQQQK